MVLTLVGLAWLWWGGQHLWLVGGVLHVARGVVRLSGYHCPGGDPACDGVDLSGFTGSRTSLGDGWEAEIRSGVVVVVCGCGCVGCGLWCLVGVFGVVL